MRSNGFRPLVVGQLPSGGYVICSETAALNVVGAEFIKDVQPGELITVTNAGMTAEQYTTHTQLAVCSMEYIYFARPDSEIHGVNVHQARVAMGKRLAQEQPAAGDIVVGVPNSGLSAAIGYAQESGIRTKWGSSRVSTWRGPLFSHAGAARTQRAPQAFRAQSGGQRQAGRADR